LRRRYEHVGESVLTRCVRNWRQSGERNLESVVNLRERERRKKKEEYVI